MEFTPNARFSDEDIDKFDVDGLLGDLQNFPLDHRQQGIASAHPPSVVFCKIDLSTPSVWPPSSYGLIDFSNKRILDADISLMRSKNKKIARNLSVIQRDMKHLAGDGVYFFNTQDAQEINYKEFFQLEHHIAVIQYHRYSGQLAALAPLPGYHTYPSWNNPIINDTYRFAEKSPRIFWRGALSGRALQNGRDLRANVVLQNHQMSPDQMLETLMLFPRFKLAFQSHQHDFVDIGFVIQNGEKNSFEKYDFLRRLSRDAVSRSDHFGYRYLLSIDGFDGPSNFFWSLMTNSIVFRQKSNCEIFGDYLFKPWVHYIPIEPDIYDLYNKFSWAERNTSRCIAIIENAHFATKLFFDRARFERRLALMYQRISALAL